MGSIARTLGRPLTRWQNREREKRHLRNKTRQVSNVAMLVKIRSLANKYVDVCSAISSCHVRWYCDQCRSEDSKCTMEAISCQIEVPAFRSTANSSFHIFFVRPCIPCHPPIRVSMGRFRIGVWQRYASAKGDGLLSALALALLRPILVVWAPAKRCWTQRPGLDLAGATHIQPIAVKRKGEHDANMLFATFVSCMYDS